MHLLWQIKNPAGRLQMRFHPFHIGQRLTLGHGVTEIIVAVPAQRRRERECVTADNLDFRFRLARRIFGGNVDSIFTGFFQLAGDTAGSSIEFQSAWQNFYREGNGSFTADGQRINQRRAGLDTDHLGSVELWPGGRLGGGNY